MPTLNELHAARDNINAELQGLRGTVHVMNEQGRVLGSQLQAIDHQIALLTPPPEPDAPAAA